MNEQTLSAHVGMLATYRIGSDSYAGRVTVVSKTKHQLVFTSESGNIVKVCTRRRDGAYLVRGSKHGSIVLGRATQSLDEGF